MIKSYLEALTQQNSLLIVGSTSYPKSIDSLLLDVKNKTEKWYGTIYKNKNISNQFLNVLETSAVSGEAC